MKLIQYADPGHSWVKVPRKLLVKLGIAGEISSYSYQRGEFAFIEEDSDCNKLFEAAKAHGVVLEVKNQWTNRQSRIRNYFGYRPRPNEVPQSHVPHLTETEQWQRDFAKRGQL